MDNRRDDDSPIALLPSPERVRDRLGECARESRLLRQLLKVSERAAANTRDFPRAEVANAR
jgi:hypothetical protein